MSPATELADHLAEENIGARGGESAWSIHVSREPVDPNDVVTLYDTAGLDTEQTDIQLRQPTIQVRVRSHDYEAAFAKQNEIHDLLVLPLGRDIGAHHYLGIWLQSDIAAIGRDDNDRHLTTANYRIQRQPLSGVQS